MGRRIGLVAIALLSVIALTACADNGDDAGEPTLTRSTPTRTIATPTQETATPAAQTPAAGAEEVTGIVGAVVAATNTIEINQLSGADVTQVEVTPATQIRRATGGALTLAEIRPSDRIVAVGAVDGDVLVATRITVQDVVPGAGPGG